MAGFPILPLQVGGIRGKYAKNWRLSLNQQVGLPKQWHLGQRRVSRFFVRLRFAKLGIRNVRLLLKGMFSEKGVTRNTINRSQLSKGHGVE